MIYDTLIIGGGLVGAAMAVALKQQQRRVALLEIRPPTTDAERLEKGWDARIYAISPVNRQFLQSLHAWPSESRIQPVARMDVRGKLHMQIVYSQQSFLFHAPAPCACQWQARRPPSAKVASGGISCRQISCTFSQRA